MNWKLFKLPMYLNEIEVIYQSCYDFESLYQVIEMIHSLTNVNLKAFCWEVLKNPPLIKSFVSIPASKRHHHSFPSGLLVHSLECAYIVSNNLSGMDALSQSEKEVTLVAALFHDIGKTQTLEMSGHSSLGRLIDHEQFTLMALAEPLKHLSLRWNKGAETLAYLLTWKHSMGICRFVGGNVIKFADHFSTSVSIRDMGFEDKPSYFSFTDLQTGSKRHYINRLN